MFEDISVNKIPANNVDKPVASGGFGAVYKVKHPFVSTIIIMIRYMTFVCQFPSLNRIFGNMLL